MVELSGLLFARHFAAKSVFSFWLNWPSHCCRNCPRYGVRNSSKCFPPNVFSLGFENTINKIPDSLSIILDFFSEFQCDWVTACLETHAGHKDWEWRWEREGKWQPAHASVLSSCNHSLLTKIPSLFPWALLSRGYFKPKTQTGGLKSLYTTFLALVLGNWLIKRFSKFTST